MAVLIQSAIIAFVVALSVAFFCFTSRKSFRSYTTLGLLALAFALYNLTYLLSLIDHSPALLAAHLFLLICVSGLLLIFLSVFSLKSKAPSLYSTLGIISLMALPPLIPSLATYQASLLLVYPAFAGSINLYCALLLYRASQTVEDTVEKNKIKLLLVGILLCLVFSFGDFLRKLGIPAPAFGSMIISVFLILLYRLVPIATLKDLREVVINGVRATVICLGISIVYLIIAGWAHQNGELYFLNTFLASLLLMFGLAPTRDRIEGFFLKHFFYDKQVLYSAIETVESKIGETQTPEMLLTLLRQAFTKSLRIENVHIYLIGTDDEVRRLAQTPETAPSPNIDKDSPIVKFLARFKVPLNTDQLRFEIGKLKFRRPEEKTFFAGLAEKMNTYSFSLVLPMTARDKPFGFIAIEIPKTKTGPAITQFSQEEIKLLERLAERITRQLEQVQYLEKLNIQARLAILGEMSAALAHEIKNPLAAVKGAAGCAKTYTDPIKREKYLNIISDEVDRLDLVVNQFLNVAKQPDLTYTADVKKIVEKCLSLAEINENAKKITLSMQFTADSLIAAIDPLRLQQVLLNLINNAVEAIGDRGCIAIKGAIENGTIQITVTDDGPGMNEETLGKIFVPFFTTKTTGSGLGLTISQNITALFGGKLTAESEPGKGTTFTIELKEAPKPA